MKHVNYKWLLIGTLSYIACSIVASALFSIGVMFMFGHIDPSQLKAVQPTATIFDIGEPLIGFTVAILVAYWVARKTLETQTRTIWFYVHVSDESEHSFRFNPITHFGLNRSPVSVLSDHF